MKRLNHGFVKVAAAIPVVTVADCLTNSQRIITLMQEADSAGVQAVCFPELSITGYTCADLFHQTALIERAEEALAHIVAASKTLDVLTIVGIPVAVDNQLFNCAAVVCSGKVLGVVPKTFLPNHREFYEVRWFASATDADIKTICLNGEEDIPFGNDLLFDSTELCFSIELCEDLWTPVPPSSLQTLAGAQIVFNLSASDELAGKDNYRRQLIEQQSARCISGYVYASAGFGESSTDLLFAGNGYIAENGTLLAATERFSLDSQLLVSEIDVERLANERQRNHCFMRGPGRISRQSFRHIPFSLSGKTFPSLTRYINPKPFVPSGKLLNERCEEIFNTQVNALAVRLRATQVSTVVVGISGGLDSTLALLVTVAAFDRLHRPRTEIIGITMPGFGTTERTYNNACRLMQKLGITAQTIDITAACRQHFTDIGHNIDKHDVIFENTQARERTQLLMDIANQRNGLVVGTGDMSELALGWATYNGDHMSMYGVNAGVPKTLVRHLIEWRISRSDDGDEQAILRDICATPISPELLPATEKGDIAQRTEEIVGPYILHDFFLYYLLRFGFSPAKIAFLATQTFAESYDRITILRCLREFFHRFFTQQFKRSCMPDGIKVGSVSLSPRSDWRMPSDASAAQWMDEIDRMLQQITSV
ncbi:MAG: NAD(+) synthase [Prevotellaceae bacterium]|jgi:NAD+ synthase (glutamine-hydrolysing)|nr:NAD(+) synthase [Prevotellaceae bacterium]